MFLFSLFHVDFRRRVQNFGFRKVICFCASSIIFWVNLSGFESMPLPRSNLKIKVIAVIVSFLEKKRIKKGCLPENLWIRGEEQIWIMTWGKNDLAGILWLSRISALIWLSTFSFLSWRKVIRDFWRIS